MRGNRLGGNHGFSLLELLMSMAVLVAIMGVVLSLLNNYQRTYGRQQQLADLRQGLRGAVTLMSEEIGQAGYLGFVPTRLTNAVTGSSSAQVVQVAPNASTPYLFPGENLLVDAGAAEEVVQITGVSGSAITGVFTNSHNSGASVNVLGAFPTGILASSNGQRLELYGDISGSGTLEYVEYNCDMTAGVLTRSVTPLNAASKQPASVLLRNLVANPEGTPCFQYETQVYPPGSGTTYVTDVTVVLTSQTSEPDPATHLYPKLTSSFSVVPRNVLAALGLAQSQAGNRLQPTPPGLPMP